MSISWHWIRYTLAQKSLDEKNKLLFRIERLGGGGVEKSFVTLLHYLDYSRYKVDLLLNHRDGIYLSQISEQVGLFSLVERKDFFEKKIYYSNPAKNLEQTAVRILPTIPQMGIQTSLVQQKTRHRNRLSRIDSTLYVKRISGAQNLGWIHLDFNGGFYSKKRVSQFISSAQKIDRLITVSHQAKDSLSSLSSTLGQKT